ncbi:monovalent cation/H(+) antiporter subunit G [Gelria sp. Kuro-4]|uniref:monovalent cation/H(+) antiporter subunit G n=1 Tax=Gelria sp. Kuro-4 TaxID=2796927 RepID=UPI001BF08BF3|nr:monovalent cation/H(+) antiporter subunit G [Gelria sp. Kuro-4]BCV25348.1 hypothetical protein kuro4_21210 [Gelria sp. Kuro-4]
MLVASKLLLLGGLFFSFTATLGLLRLPDVYNRLHATTKCDTLGAGLILLALILSGRPPEQAVKLVVILIFLWLANPTAAHILARAAWAAGTPLARGTELPKEERPC